MPMLRMTVKLNVGSLSLAEEIPVTFVGFV